MKVKELIEILKTFPEDAEVTYNLNKTSPSEITCEIKHDARNKTIKKEVNLY